MFNPKLPVSVHKLKRRAWLIDAEGFTICEVKPAPSHTAYDAARKVSQLINAGRHCEVRS